MTKKYNLAYATDIHLNFITGREKSPKLFQRFVDEINRENPDGLVLTGDLSEATELEKHLRMLSASISCSIWFVLGNHDYYNGSILATREMVKSLCLELPNLHWLHSLPDGSYPPMLGSDTCLIGADGWYDGLYAPFGLGSVVMNDWYIIKEFKENGSWNNVHWTPSIITKTHNLMKLLATESADLVELYAVNAVARGAKNIIIATHVPPFRENSVYNGKISNDTWLPCFSSKIMGDKILNLGERYKDIKFTVLCGHSHGYAKHNPAINIESLTGFSRYEHPWESIKFFQID